MSYANLIQPVLWLIFGGATAFLGVKALLAKKKNKPVKKWLYAAAVAGVFALVIVPSIAVVPAGYRGVVYRWDGGVDPNARGEGVSFIVPWFNHINTMSVRTQKVYSPTIYAQSSDLQEITVVGSVNYHVNPKLAPHLYQAVGPAYAQTVIQPALFQRVKAEVGQIKAIDFAVERQHLATKIGQELNDQLKGYGIVVEYVNIEDAIFDPKFVAAVKNKIIAQQFAAQQRNLIAARAAMKQQTIINAQAQARSILIRANAQAAANIKISKSLLLTPLFLKYTALKQWNGALPSTLVGDLAKILLGIGGGTSSSGSSFYGG